MRKILSLTILSAWSLVSIGQTDKELADKSVNQGIIKSHIGFLASDELKGRDTPSEGLKIAAKYIESRFVEYGVQLAPGMDSYFQPVPMKKVSPPESGTIKIGETELKLNDDFVIMDGSSSISNQPFFYAEYAMPEELNRADVEGKVVFALCGDGKSQSPQEWFTLAGEKRKKVKELGGMALVELYNSPQIPWNFLVRYLNREQVVIDEGDDNEQSMAHIWLNRSADDVSFLESGTSASIDIPASKSEKFTSQNIVGYLPGADDKLKEEFVVYSAHYDHVGIGQADANGDSIYNGSRDNAVGTVTVLSAAQNLALNPTKRSALFVLFTGEEKGLLGSKAFVDNSPIDLSKIVYCFNSDNGGYNDTSKATIIGLTRTTAEEMIIEACKAFGLEAIEDPAPEQGLFDRSDNVRFAVKGIPAPTFSMGFTAFDDEITKYYHQAGDNPNTLDYVYLERFFKSYVYACRLIGNSKKAPFWVKGDKYYDSGKELYK
ncbi:M28 family peptidase [Ekhidna sp.]|uniref:M28 family peptidase n=1 Tax=Ekhidna sp. TaxID=2608089 RepID=UPI0035198AD6